MSQPLIRAQCIKAEVIHVQTKRRKTEQERQLKLMRETAVNKRQPGAFTNSAWQERVREEDTCALPGQAVKYPCGPLVQRAAQSPALLLSFCSFPLSSHSYPLHFAPLTVRSGCRELVLHFYQSHLRLSTKESSASPSALRL